MKNYTKIQKWTLDIDKRNNIDLKLKQEDITSKKKTKKKKRASFTWNFVNRVLNLAQWSSSNSEHSYSTKNENNCSCTHTYIWLAKIVYWPTVSQIRCHIGTMYSLKCSYFQNSTQLEYAIWRVILNLI